MYLPELNWETQVASVIKIDATHYECTVSPTNPNDPGGDTAEIIVGECYLMDYVGHIFDITQVVSGTLTKVIRVLDSFGEDMGPQQGRSAYVYKSVGSGKAPYVSPVNYRRLDASAIDYALPIEKDIIWRHRGLHGVGTGIDEVNLTKVTLGAGLKFSDLLSTGWQGGKSVTLTAIDRYCGSGGVDDDSFTDNGNGTVTIGAKTYKLYDNVEGKGYSLEYLIAGNTFTPTDNAYSYIVANYNAGTPVLQITTDVSTINETTIIPVLSVYRDGIRLHTTPWGTIGNAKVDKLHQSIVKTQRYRRESGLAISVVATNKLSLTAGVMWIGAVRRPISQYTQGDAGGVTLALTKVAGVWTSTSATSFNNTLYQNGANVATLTNNRYCVLFVFRGVETNKHIYYVYGTGDYIESEAKAAVVPSDLPPIITSHCILVGRVISQKSSTTPLEVASAFDTVFATQAGAPSHNNLAGLQGIGPDYYHLMYEQYRGVSAGSGGYLPRYNVAGWLENSKFTDDGITPKYNTNTIWHAGNSNSQMYDWSAKILSVGSFLSILNGGDLNLQAPTGSQDSGDIVFRDGTGLERHRIYDGLIPNTLTYRYLSGAVNAIWHSGNDGHNSGMDADTVDGYQASELFTTGVYCGDANDFSHLGTEYWTPSTLNKPEQGYGTVFNLQAGIDWKHQLEFGTDGDLTFRNNINSTGWSDRKRIWHSANSNLSTVDWTTKNVTTNGLHSHLYNQPLLLRSATTGYGSGLRYDTNGSETLIVSTTNSSSKIMFACGHDVTIDAGVAPKLPLSPILTLSSTDIKIGSLAGYLKATLGVVGAVSSIPESDITPTAYSTLTVTSNAATWNCSTGLNKRVTISANLALTITNLVDGMSGDLVVNVSSVSSITITTTGFTQKKYGSLTSKPIGKYHLCWICEGTNIDFNITDTPYA